MCVWGFATAAVRTAASVARRREELRTKVFVQTWQGSDIVLLQTRWADWMQMGRSRQLIGAQHALDFGKDEDAEWMME
jgi:hypothetical protein